MKSTTSILHTFCCPRKRKKSSKIDPFDSNQCSSSRIVRELFHLTSPTFPLNTSYFSLNALMAQLVRKRLMIKISHLMLTPFQLEVPNESMEVLLILALTLRLRSFLYWKLIALVPIQYCISQPFLRRCVVNPSTQKLHRKKASSSAAHSSLFLHYT